MKLIRILKVVLNAILLALRLEKTLEEYYKDIPPQRYSKALAEFDESTRLVYKKQFSESFKMLIVWSPLHR